MSLCNGIAVSVNLPSYSTAMPIHSSVKVRIEPRKPLTLVFKDWSGHMIADLTAIIIS